ncbi:MAG: exodeoxyribonuclease VII large subunit [Treponema sp.]
MEKVYSISEITNKVKVILEEGVGYIGLEGEVSNFKAQSSGHLYFTLKDDDAAISAVMFRAKAMGLKFNLKDGLTVKAFGSITVYQKRGVYQIIIDKMELSGEGDILRMLELRKQKLASEGLFDSKNKRPLPFFPEKVAIITSPTGAAVQDIINVCTRRNPKLQLNILPAVVQGEDAAPSLIRQLKIANLHNLGDVIIIGRGGGSIEDLLPFSDEGVVREIAASNIPVISSVGHEIDWALSDFASDVRAPTPSAAAELVTPLLSEVTRKLEKAHNELLDSINRRIEKLKLLCSAFSGEHLENMFMRIEQPFLMRFNDAKEDLLRNMKERILEMKRYHMLLAERLNGLSPKDILKRGFSIVSNEKGQSITNAKDVKIDEKLKVMTYTGSFDVSVLSK